jgi:hypothetical protein
MSASGSSAATLASSGASVSVPPAMVPVSGAASSSSCRDGNRISRAAPNITTITPITIRFATEISMNDQLRYVPG